jgi:TPR repeat protein
MSVREAAGWAAPKSKPQRRSRAALSRWLAVTPALLLIAAMAAAQTTAGPPPQVAPDLAAALDKAQAGAPEELVRLADSGRQDAQYYAGVMFLFGRGGVPADPARGCAYEQKASAHSAEAMRLVGECYRQGALGKPDPEKAKAAFARAVEMGDPKSKCALGRMLMAEPADAARGLALCKEAATAGDVDAQLAVADAYFAGRGAPLDRKEARAWYDRAVQAKSPQAARKLGEMYANGDGGKKDTKKAVELWRQAETAGDPLAPILVADQLFADITGGKKPGPGTFAFKGGVPVGDIEIVQSWYQEALDRDPRPDVKQRAKYAISVLEQFKKAGQTSASAK